MQTLQRRCRHRFCARSVLLRGFDERGDEFVDAALARVRGLVVEDCEELAAALQRRHAIPAGASFRAPAQRQCNRRRQLDFGFHRGDEALGHLPGAFHAGCVGLYAEDPLADLATGKLAEVVIPGTQAGLVVEEDGEFVGWFRIAGVEVRLESKLRSVTGASVGTLLHGTIHEQIETSARVRK